MRIQEINSKKHYKQSFAALKMPFKVSPDDLNSMKLMFFKSGEESLKPKFKTGKENGYFTIGETKEGDVFEIHFFKNDKIQNKYLESYKNIYAKVSKQYAEGSFVKPEEIEIIPDSEAEILVENTRKALLA